LLIIIIIIIIINDIFEAQILIIKGAMSTVQQQMLIKATV